jgi:hypothetical protein
MKTKIALLVTILAASLFGAGCAGVKPIPPAPTRVAPSKPVVSNNQVEGPMTFYNAANRIKAAISKFKVGMEMSEVMRLVEFHPPYRTESYFVRYKIKALTEKVDGQEVPKLAPDWRGIPVPVSVGEHHTFTVLHYMTKRIPDPKGKAYPYKKWTPVVFRNGKLHGWGDKFWSELKAEIEKGVKLKSSVSGSSAKISK